MVIGVVVEYSKENFTMQYSLSEHGSATFCIDWKRVRSYATQSSTIWSGPDWKVGFRLKIRPFCPSEVNEVLFSK